VTFGALDDSPAVGRNDSPFINMHSMIETQVRVIGSLFRSEVRMCIKKIGHSLEGNVIGQFTVAVGAQSLVSLYEFGWFVVLEMAGGAANFAKDIRGWRRRMAIDGMAIQARRVGYALKQVNVTSATVIGYRCMCRVHRARKPQAVVGQHTTAQH
jgi:hypothetical protein